MDIALEECPTKESKNPDTPDTDTVSVVRNLVPSPIRFDMSSGRVRYFGPTTNMNVLTTSNPEKVLERLETHWPICTVLRDVSPDTHDYLMDLYWTWYNSVLHLVHSHAFYHDQERGGTQFYSLLLHVAMLATGFRYADKTSKDIQRLMMSGRFGSTLHEKAVAMAKLEIDSPGGIPSIQAFGLLADIDFNIGKDDSGWLFAGMSLRLVIDVGLHVDPSPLRLSVRETQIRYMVLWACLVNDRYWSLYLGRPTTLKACDIAPTCLSKDFTSLICCGPSGREKMLTTRIYEAQLQLMDLVSPLCDRSGVARPARTTENYFKIVALDEDLHSWYDGLPEDLKWPPQEPNMPMSYFLLQTQYHAAFILLNRPFVHYGDREHAHTAFNAHFTQLSRSVCAENAARIVEVFETYRANSDLAQMFFTGLAHIGTAATTLMGEAVLLTDPVRRGVVISQLRSLREIIALMAPTYPPGHHMVQVVDEFNRSDQLQQNASPRSTAREDSTHQNSRLGNVGRARHVPPYMQDEEQGTQGPPHKRTRVGNINPYLFTPTVPASPSLQGLPCLPPTFWESLDFSDLVFADQGGYSDYGFAWNDPEVTPMQQEKS
ncbi:regulatory protein CefR [Coniochaeta sp. 2T2.1]|nr:regulatory protein CefR [Coniochaeta sp. 2T2.1]